MNPQDEFTVQLAVLLREGQNDRYEMRASRVERVKRIAAPKPFAGAPSRMVEWFGGVTYENLDKAVFGIKQLMLDNPEDEIQLLVNSFGGGTGIGMSFFDTITSVLRPNLTTIGSGDVDSSGIIVFLAGRQRFLTKNTTLLLHLAGRFLDQPKRFSTSEFENILREDRLKDFQYACVVSEATSGNYSPKQILDLMHQDTILTAEEAVSMGLAHAVL